MSAIALHDRIPFKILILGDAGVGKTSLIKRFSENKFSENYKATIGVEFAVKELQIGDKTVLIQVWDVAGQPRYRDLVTNFFRDTHGACIVFDRTERSSFENVTGWKTTLDDKVRGPDDKPLPAFLLASKCDLASEITQAAIDQKTAELGFTRFFETSAKINRGITEAITALVTEILERQPKPSQPSPGVVDITHTSPVGTSGCSC